MIDGRVAELHFGVAQGAGQPSIRGDLRHPLFLGSDGFIARFALGVRALDKLRETPQARAVLSPGPLGQYQRTYPGRREAMARAVHSGVYTMQKIADHFDVYYSTVSRAVRRFETLRKGDA